MNVVSTLVVFLFMLLLSSSVRGRINENLDLQEETGCIVAPEIVLVQDISSSYKDDLENLHEAMPAIFEMLEKEFGRTKFSVTSFVDSPVCSFPNDHCSMIWQTLKDEGAKSMKKTQEVFRNMTAGGGGAPPENLLGAIIRAALSPQIGWTLSDTQEDGIPVVRILIATTDQVPQMPGNKANCAKRSFAGLSITQPMPITNGDWLAYDINAGCLEYEFPSIDDVIKVLQRQKIVPIFLFGNAYNAEVGGMVGSYKKFAKRFKYYPKDHPEIYDDFENGLTNLMKAVFNDHYKYYPVMLRETLSSVVSKECIQYNSQTTEAFSIHGSTKFETNSSTISDSYSANATRLVSTTSTVTTSTTRLHGSRIPKSPQAQGDIIAGPPSSIKKNDDLAAKMLASNLIDDLSTTSTQTTPTKNPDETRRGSSGIGIIIGSASGGIAALAGIAAAVAKIGWLSNGIDNSFDENINVEVDVPRFEIDREIFEPVTVELFQ